MEIAEDCRFSCPRSASACNLYSLWEPASCGRPILRARLQGSARGCVRPGGLGRGAPRARTESSPRRVPRESPATRSAPGRAAPLEVEHARRRSHALAVGLRPPRTGHPAIPDAYMENSFDSNRLRDQFVEVDMESQMGSRMEPLSSHEIGMDYVSCASQPQSDTQ